VQQLGWKFTAETNALHLPCPLKLQKAGECPFNVIIAEVMVKPEFDFRVSFRPMSRQHF